MKQSEQSNRAEEVKLHIRVHQGTRALMNSLGF